MIVVKDGKAELELSDLVGARLSVGGMEFAVVEVVGDKVSAVSA